MSRARTPGTWVLCACVLAAVLAPQWVRVHVSPSVPSGLYRLVSVPPQLARGTLVVVPVPARVRPWWSSWVPLLKPVAAIAGGVVCMGDNGVWSAGQWYGPLFQDAHGQPLPRLRRCVVLQPGHVFLASDMPRSLDGRSFGVTPVAALTAHEVPLLTW